MVYCWNLLQILTGQKTTPKKPKTTVSVDMKTLENLKIKNYKSDITKTCRYVYHLSNFHLLKTEGVNRRVAEGT